MDKRPQGKKYDIFTNYLKIFAISFQVMFHLLLLGISIRMNREHLSEHTSVMNPILLGNPTNPVICVFLQCVCV